MRTIDFSFRELEIFCKVVELESFSRAAEAVFLVQASVSERIASLEKKIGARLLDRMGRKVIPTTAGELLHKHATLLLEMKETAGLEIESFLGLEQGEISMGGSTIPGEYILPYFIGRFNKKYPHLSVKLTIADSRKIENSVLAGKLEIGVIGSKSQHMRTYYAKNYGRTNWCLPFLFNTHGLNERTSPHRSCGKHHLSCERKALEP